MSYTAASYNFGIFKGNVMLFSSVSGKGGIVVYSGGNEPIVSTTLRVVLKKEPNKNGKRILL